MGLRKFDLQELFSDDPELIAILTEAPARPAAPAPAFAAAYPAASVAFDLSALDMNLDLRDWDLFGESFVLPAYHSSPADEQAHRPYAAAGAPPVADPGPAYGKPISVSAHPATFDPAAYRPPAARRTTPSFAATPAVSPAFTAPPASPASAAPVPKAVAPRVFIPSGETGPARETAALDADFGSYFNSILRGRPIPPEMVSESPATPPPVAPPGTPSPLAAQPPSARFGQDDLRAFLRERTEHVAADPFPRSEPPRPAPLFRTASLDLSANAELSQEEPEPPRYGLLRRAGGIVFNVVFFLLCASLLAGAAVFAIRDDPEKSYLGYRFFNVLTDSMRPVEDGLPGGFTKDDVIVVKSVPLEEIGVGDVITFRPSQAQSAFLTYRVLEIPQSGPNGEPGVYFRTRGDAGTTEERLVAASQVVGKAVFVIPRLGILLQFVREHYVWILVFLISAFVLMISLRLALGRPRRERRQKTAMISY
jgi:signal peptidase I